jgi:hypothetical protein
MNMTYWSENVKNERSGNTEHQNPWHVCRRGRDSEKGRGGRVDSDGREGDNDSDAVDQLQHHTRAESKPASRPPAATARPRHREDSSGHIASGAEDSAIRKNAKREEKHARKAAQPTHPAPEAARCQDAHSAASHTTVSLAPADASKGYSDLVNYQTVEEPAKKPRTQPVLFVSPGLSDHRLGEGEDYRKARAKGLCRRLRQFTERLSFAYWEKDEDMYCEDAYQRWNGELGELEREASPYGGCKAVKHAPFDARDCLEASRGIMNASQRTAIVGEEGAQEVCQRLTEFGGQLSNASWSEGFKREDYHQRWSRQLEELESAASLYGGNEDVRYELWEARDCMRAMMEDSNSPGPEVPDESDLGDLWDPGGEEWEARHTGLDDLD